MIASEYIKKLESLIKQEGDLPVVILDDRGGNPAPDPDACVISSYYWECKELIGQKVICL